MAHIEPGEVREFAIEDVDQLLTLMHALAVFEGYDSAFRVSREALIDNGLGDSPLFRAYVMPDRLTGRILGMAVTYAIPWTYTLRPDLVLKELYVLDEARGMGVGDALMQAVISEAVSIDAFRLQWTVLESNDTAKRFYSSLGADKDTLWEKWELKFSTASSNAAPITMI